MRTWAVLCACMSTTCLMTVVSLPQMIGSSSFLNVVGPMLVGSAVALHIYLFITIVRLRLAVGDLGIVAVLLSMPALIPGLGLLIAPFLVEDARYWLRERLGRMPLLGFSKATIAKWSSHCEHCGYDLRGLAVLMCPECGATFARV